MPTLKRRESEQEREEMRNEMFWQVHQLRIMVPAMVLCIGLLLSFLVGGYGMMAPLPRDMPASLEIRPAMTGDGRRAARITPGLFNASKRRVPKGPDPIHNRGAPFSFLCYLGEQTIYFGLDPKTLPLHVLR
ncbi:CLAVATA3/ESR (CLE)-related protein 25 [Platanthera zijinensis]|uniref:CLAVATA3/ESR (CLE)-related protein 25 n=1 Tax=Platanthera zijinensis TaxID=2320716 RepID=A0AAP0BLR1_9ASPA